MTSPTLPELTQQELEGRSVRDVVEYSPEQVNDAWCRKVLRKILQSLELQYAMQMPHRTITSDTVVFHANGEPFLISDDIDAAPASDAEQASDLTALAGVIHYAITQDLIPAGPLHGRAAGYSAALIATVDACMDPDPARRPRRVDAVLAMLGMAAPGPLAGAVTLSTPAPAAAPPQPQASSAATAPSAVPTPGIFPPLERVIPEPAGIEQGIEVTPEAAVVMHHGGMRRSPRWAFLTGGGAVAIVLALLLFAGWRGNGVFDHGVQTQSQTASRVGTDLSAPDSAAAAGAVAGNVHTGPAAGGTPADPAGAAAPVPAQIAPAVGAPGGVAPETPASNGAGSLGASSGGTTRSGDAEQSERVTRSASSPAGTPDAAASQPVVTARAAAKPPANGEASAEARATAPSGVVAGNASYQLQIKPWGTLYVDGVDRGVSPPVKRLTLTPGHHTIRITNPNYRDSVLEFDSAPTTSNGKIIIDFTREEQ